MTIIRETEFDLLTRKRKGEKYGTPNGILSKINDSASVMLVEKNMWELNYHGAWALRKSWVLMIKIKTKHILKKVLKKNNKVSNLMDLAKIFTVVSN